MSDPKEHTCDWCEETGCDYQDHDPHCTCNDCMAEHIAQEIGEDEEVSK